MIAAGRHADRARSRGSPAAIGVAQRGCCRCATSPSARGSSSPARGWLRLPGVHDPRARRGRRSRTLEFRGRRAGRARRRCARRSRRADAIVIGPSNPLASIGPILAVPGMREALAGARAPVVAVSPIVGGEVLKGPTASFMAFAGLDRRAPRASRDHYGELLDGIVSDEPSTGSRPRLRPPRWPTRTAARGSPARRSTSPRRCGPRPLAAAHYRPLRVRTAAVLPVKRLPLAKQRLGATLDGRAPRARARDGRDVIAALVRSAERSR